MDSINIQADHSRINFNFGKNIQILLFSNSTEESKK